MRCCERIVDTLREVRVELGVAATFAGHRIAEDVQPPRHEPLGVVGSSEGERDRARDHRDREIVDDVEPAVVERPSEEAVDELGHCLTVPVGGAAAEPLFDQLPVGAVLRRIGLDRVLAHRPQCRLLGDRHPERRRRRERRPVASDALRLFVPEHQREPLIVEPRAPELLHRASVTQSVGPVSTRQSAHRHGADAVPHSLSSSWSWSWSCGPSPPSGPAKEYWARRAPGSRSYRGPSCRQHRSRSRWSRRT